MLYDVKCKGITDTVILVAGDCGIGFEKPGYYDQLYHKLGKSLRAANCILLLMRGNHDDPEYFQKESIDFPLMKTIPDYSVIQIADRNVLCVGGAVSIDREYRQTQMWLAKLKNRQAPSLYWEDEMPRYKSDQLAEIKSQGISVDAVVTHTAPSFCFPMTKAGIESWLAKDSALSDDLDSERKTMDDLYEQLRSDKHPLSSWFYAHFHCSHIEYISGVRFQLLNIMELAPI